MQNLVAVSHRGLYCVRAGPKNFGDSVYCTPFYMWLTPRNNLLPHMCYHAKFGRAISNCMGVGRVPKIFGTLGPRRFGMGEWGVDLRLETPFSSSVLRHQILIILVQTIRA